jgi:hypothetical protein
MAEMIQKGAEALGVCTCKEGRNQHGLWRLVDNDCPACGTNEAKAKAVIDAIMPEVNNLYGLLSYTVCTKFLSKDGNVWSMGRDGDFWLLTTTGYVRSIDPLTLLADYGPLQVVWVSPR